MVDDSTDFEIDWDKTSKTVKMMSGEEPELVEFCEECGKAGADIHEMRGLGDHRYPVCENCGSRTLKRTTRDKIENAKKELKNLI